eukprot:JP446478.1.p4 GENE.JP446478.1~~JP446478.1.p4  ORF type:complete len:54 (+),score=3.99 JP446478.1:82-243(+)
MNPTKLQALPSQQPLSHRVPSKVRKNKNLQALPFQKPLPRRVPSKVRKNKLLS